MQYTFQTDLNLIKIKDMTEEEIRQEKSLKKTQ